jgi:hypothetical protein
MILIKISDVDSRLMAVRARICMRPILEVSIPHRRVTKAVSFCTQASCFGRSVWTDTAHTDHEIVPGVYARRE